MSTILLNFKAARSGTVQSSRGSGELEGTDPHVDILGIAVTAAGAVTVLSSDDSYVIPSSFSVGTTQLTLPS